MDCAKQHVWMQIEHLYTVNKHQLKKVSEFSIIFSAICQNFIPTANIKLVINMPGLVQNG